MQQECIPNNNIYQYECQYIIYLSFRNSPQEKSPQPEFSQTSPHIAVHSPTDIMGTFLFCPVPLFVSHTNSINDRELIALITLIAHIVPVAIIYPTTGQNHFPLSRSMSPRPSLVFPSFLLLTVPLRLQPCDRLVIGHAFHVEWRDALPELLIIHFSIAQTRKYHVFNVIFHLLCGFVVLLF